LGYQKLRNKNYDNAIAIFEINVALYPDSPNVYDSLGEAYMEKGDTIEAINNYKKSLSLDSGNRRAKSRIKELENKD
jgi:tetratricopeptide (TPR) repeat protein